MYLYEKGIKHLYLRKCQNWNDTHKWMFWIVMYLDRLNGVMVSVLALSAEGREFDHRLTVCQTKDIKI